MLYTTPFPIVLYKDQNQLPFIDAIAIKKTTTIDNQDVSNVAHYKAAEISMSEVDVALEELFILKLLNFMNLNIMNWGKSEATIEQVISP